jgi:hypothetical protein
MSPPAETVDFSPYDASKRGPYVIPVSGSPEQRPRGEPERQLREKGAFFGVKRGSIFSALARFRSFFSDSRRAARNRRHNDVFS